jgi:hypothetical protein
MATPHVAGAAALYLATYPAATPAQVRDALVADATAGTVTNAGAGTPNRLLYVAGIGATPPVSTTPAPTTPTTPALCTVTNTYDRSIGDRATVESKLTVAGCAGNGSAASTVQVAVKHSDRGDLAVWLVAPDGTAYKLKSAVSGDNVRDLSATYPLNLASEARNGVWKLKVSDMYFGDTGYLDAWTLKL